MSGRSSQAVVPRKLLERVRALANANARPDYLPNHLLAGSSRVVSFEAVHTGALPQGHITSELFGHEATSSQPSSRTSGAQR